MIMFRSGETTHIKASVPLKMLITNTKAGRNTRALVSGVFERVSRHPDAMSSVLCVIDLISKEFASIIESPAFDDESICAKEDKIEELMKVNQGLLQIMGVPISLAIRVASLRGTLRLHIKLPPSDQLWLGFTSMTEIDLNLESSVGD